MKNKEFQIGKYCLVMTKYSDIEYIVWLQCKTISDTTSPWKHSIIVWLQCKTISDTTSPWKHSIKQQTVPVWNILTRNNFNNGVFHFRIQWQIDLLEGVFGIANHDGLSIVNQLKKTTNELIFTMRKWVESFSCGCANLANRIRKCCLDLRCLVCIQKES